MRLVFLLLAILYFAIPVFADEQKKSGSIDVKLEAKDSAEIKNILEVQKQQDRIKEIENSMKTFTQYCRKVNGFNDVCSDRFNNCASQLNECGDLTKNLAANFNADKLGKITDIINDEGEVVKKADLKDAQAQLKKNREDALKKLNDSLGKGKDKSKQVNLGPCSEFSTNQIIAYLNKNYESVKKDIPEGKKEIDRLEEKLSDIRKNNLEKELDITGQIQKNALQAKKLSSDLQIALNEAPVALQAKIDELKAQFEIQNTVINDIKAAVVQLDQELQDKNEDIEQQCVDDAEKTVKEKRAEWKNKRTQGRNNLSFNAALNSAAIKGADGEDNISFRSYFAECLEKRKIKGQKSRAIGEYNAKKAKLQNELQRAIIQAAKIQTLIKQEIEKSSLATKNAAQKINSEVAALNMQNQQLSEQLGKLSSVNGNQLAILQAKLDEEKMQYAVNINEEKTLKEATALLGPGGKLDADSKADVDKLSKVRDEINDLASKQASFSESDPSYKELSKYFGSQDVDCKTKIEKSKKESKSDR